MLKGFFIFLFLLPLLLHAQQEGAGFISTCTQGTTADPDYASYCQEFRPGLYTTATQNKNKTWSCQVDPKKNLHVTNPEVISASRACYREYGSWKTTLVNGTPQCLPCDADREKLFNKPTSPNFQYAYPRSPTLKIDTQRLGDCFTQAAVQAIDKFTLHANYSTLGYVATETSEMNEFCQNSKSHTEGALNDKVRPGSLEMFTYLSASRCRKFDLITSHEEALTQWVYAQPDNSISPPALFKQAISLNKGNVLAAGVTAHQVLRQKARCWDYLRYQCHGSEGEKIPEFWNKLIDIRGDLKEREKYKYWGDHAGSWYRFFAAVTGKLSLDLSSHVSSLGYELNVTSTAEQTYASVVYDGFWATTKKVAKNSLTEVPRQVLGSVVDYVTLIGSDSADDTVKPNGVFERDGAGKGRIDADALATGGVLLHNLRLTNLANQNLSCDPDSYLIPTADRPFVD